MLNADLDSESENRSALIEAIAHCESVSDFISREMLKSILSDTEKHIDWIAIQQDLIVRIGLERYLAEKISSSDS